MRTTEKESLYSNLESMSSMELLRNINREDQKVALIIEKILPSIEAFIEACKKDIQEDGRLFYIGAGTSGRLGIVDASECPPTFGVDHGKVVGLIAGGDSAIRKAVEFAEDDTEQGWKDLEAYDISTKDTVVGIAASGSTPYVLGALRKCQEMNIRTACITCNPEAKIAEYSDYPMIAVVGPEFVTGSTRMKAGTAQKLILNMISTSLMIHRGHIQGNRMIDMQLSNDKLVERGELMIQKLINVNRSVAKELLEEHGSVRKAIEAYRRL